MFRGDSSRGRKDSTSGSNKASPYESMDGMAIHILANIWAAYKAGGDLASSHPKRIERCSIDLARSHPNRYKPLGQLPLLQEQQGRLLSRKTVASSRRHLSVTWKECHIGSSLPRLEAVECSCRS